VTTAEELLVEVLSLDAAIHRTYPNTAVCWGGVGGNMITHHCALECDNPKHRDEKIAWQRLKSQIHHYLEEARNDNKKV